jgi:hypothetical protein
VRCTLARDFTVGKALAWRSSIDADVPYQRESFVWSIEQQQLFVDSLLNGFDVPKIYLHDLRGEHPTKVYAIVDGKQRLTTIWRFLQDELPLAPDFRVAESNLPDLPPGIRHPLAGDVFSKLDRAWQRVLRGTYLSVVLIRNASPDDIEELFSRLNNGEPLNAAERRNAFGGGMAELVRELVRHPFFTERLPFGNERFAHHDLAARVLSIESTGSSVGGAPDLRAASLDDFVRGGRSLRLDARAELAARATVMLDRLTEVFRHSDPLLTRTTAPLAYLFVRGLDDEAPAGRVMPERIRSFLEQFEAERRAALVAPESDRPRWAFEFTLLSDHDTGLPNNIDRRIAILRDAWRARRF